MKDKLQKRIRELVPKLMELSFGCEIYVHAEEYGTCNEGGCSEYSEEISEVGTIVEGNDEIIFRDDSPVSDVYVSLFKEGYDEDAEWFCEIIGHPIHLDSARQAIPKKRWAELIVLWKNGTLEDQPESVYNFLDKHII